MPCVEGLGQDFATPPSSWLASPFLHRCGPRVDQVQRTKRSHAKSAERRKSRVPHTSHASVPRLQLRAADVLVPSIRWGHLHMPDAPGMPEAPELGALGLAHDPAQKRLHLRDTVTPQEVL